MSHFDGDSTAGVFGFGAFWATVAMGTKATNVIARAKRTGFNRREYMRKSSTVKVNDEKFYAITDFGSNSTNSAHQRDIKYRE
jgi:hypothetical protein